VRDAVKRHHTKALENDSAALDASGIDIDALFSSGVGNNANEIEAGEFSHFEWKWVNKCEQDLVVHVCGCERGPVRLVLPASA